MNDGVRPVFWHPGGCTADCRNLVLVCLFLLWMRSVSLEVGVVWTAREGQCLAPMNEFIPASPAEAGPPKVVGAAAGAEI